MFVTLAATLGLVGRAVKEWRAEGQLGETTLKVLAVLVIWLLSAPVLVRDAFAQRLPDVAPIVTILATWLAAGLVGQPGSGWHGVGPWLRRGGSALVVLLIVGSMAYGKGGVRGIYQACAVGIRNIGATTSRLVASPPFASMTDYRAVAQYAHECTESTDRLLVTWFAPEIYVGANRRFAGNQWVYTDYQNSTAQQYQVLRQMSGQSVPIVFAYPGAALFSDHWPVLTDHINRQYSEVGTLEGVRVFVDKRRRVIRASSFDKLPCFTRAPSSMASQGAGVLNALPDMAPVY